MKKLIFTLTLLTLSLTGFAQTSNVNGSIMPTITTYVPATITINSVLLPTALIQKRSMKDLSNACLDKFDNAMLKLERFVVELVSGPRGQYFVQANYPTKETCPLNPVAISTAAFITVSSVILKEESNDLMIDQDIHDYLADKTYVSAALEELVSDLRMLDPGFEEYTDDEVIKGYYAIKHSGLPQEFEKQLLQ